MHTIGALVVSAFIGIGSALLTAVGTGQPLVGVAVGLIAGGLAAGAALPRGRDDDV